VPLIIQPRKTKQFLAPTIGASQQVWGSNPAPMQQFQVPGSPIKPRFSLQTQKPIQPVTSPVAQAGATEAPPQVLAQQQLQPRRPFVLPVESGEAKLPMPMAVQQAYTGIAPQGVAAQPQMPVPELPMAIKKHKGQRKQGKLKKAKGKMTRGKLVRRALVVCSVLTIIAVIFVSQANGAAGAGTADLLRGVVGPTITAQVESWYLGVSDTTHQVQYRISGQHIEAPWTTGKDVPLPASTVPRKAVPLSPMPLDRITPMVSPALNGEGVWSAQGTAPSPYGYLPLDARAFIRPDASHPYAIVTLLQFDTRFFRLHMVAGTAEPGGPRGIIGPGVIPASDQKGNALLAAFNGGFKYADGQYGLKTNGIVYVPAQPNAATIAVTKSGQIILGAWGVDPRLNNGNTKLVAWRQNAALLINNGQINPLTQDGAAWGGTILNAAYTWRSGIGITAHGTLMYAAGPSLTALTLGEALKAAGAVMAMQTDINPFWVRAFLYSGNSHGTWNIVKLHPAMYGTGTEYLSATQRDFFYLTRFAPPLPAPHPREMAPQ
ncbi:MAG TPA: phosphodiester glycosidase family protein, partial [Ktedonobacteraceae bacterium]